jgi:TonB family protein
VAEPGKIVVAGGGTAAVHDKAILREIRGAPWDKLDPRFFAIALLSVVLHAAFVYVLHLVKLRPEEMVRIEEIPERFARLIIEKPIVKEKPKAVKEEPEKDVKETQQKPKEIEKPLTAEQKQAQRKAAKKNVAARVKRVEEKIRTVGVLGILTGTGSTARGPAVVDVLGGGAGRKERFQDLELALTKTTGLTKTDSLDLLKRDLLKSKEVELGKRKDIDDLLANVKATQKDLLKEGDFVIRAPESIEGAARKSSKRDNTAVGAVVRQNRTGIKLTYQKFLKRDPGLTGNITIRFTISAAGTITNVKILENTTKNPGFAQDLIRKIKMWRFEAIPEGDVTVTYPFVFQSS